MWYFNGNIHCENGPAIISQNKKSWYKHGILHRNDGPAVITRGGQELWYRNGILHRDDGPAVIAHTRDEWYLNGELYRENGPTIVYKSISNTIKINGIKVSFRSNKIQVLDIKETRDCSVCLTDIEGKCCKTPCNHYFHVDCFMELEKYEHFKCPNCRHKL